MQNRYKRIVLLGYMYSGKTSLGRKLSKKLGYQFYDTDKEIEMRCKCSVLNLFLNYGEQLFREAEKRVLEELLQKDNVVIATGGGTPCFFDNMDKINNHSISVYLQMDVKHILARHAKSKVKRPLLMGKQDDELRQYVTNQIKERSEYYSRADITTDAFSVCVDEVLNKINNFKENKQAKMFINH